MVDNQVHDQFHTPGVDPFKHPVKIIHGSEIFHDSPVIRNIIPVIIIGAGVDRTEPEHVHAECFQIIQVGGDAVKIADAIAVAVGKGTRVDLVNNRFFPPDMLFLIHFSHPFTLFGSV